MIFDNDRNKLRQAYADAWHKFQTSQTLSPLETQIAEVIKEHPEYHAALDKLDTDFMPEAGQTNPFLHMGMHLGLREQLATNRPLGIRDCYQALSHRLKSSHEAEHQMMECLAEALWQAQRQGQAPDEQRYLACLKKQAQID